jgi:hypothetical protein
MSWTQTDVSFKKLSNKRITTSTGKGLPEEKGASTLELYLPDIKTGTIPGTPPNATTDVLYYTGAIGQTLAVDTSVPGNLTWFATSGYGNTTNANDGSALSESQRLGNWVSDKYDAFGTVAGAGYEIKVYDKNNNLITKSDNSNWLFDYQTGILAFNNNVNSYGTGISTNGPYRIVGHRYIGPQGIIPASYGGLGYTTYTLGDILVGAGNTFIKLGVGSDNYVLTASSSSASGLTWSPTSATGLTSLNSITSSIQYFATGTSGSGFNISSSGSTHTFNIPIAGTGATGLVSTLAQSFAGIKTFTNDVIVSSTTGSTAFNTGALTVYGGLGVSGQLSFNQAALGYTGATNPSMAFIGSTTAAPITLTVLSDNSLLWEGTSGKLFGINNNLSSGWIFNVGDISGLPIIRANADGTIAMAEFTANVGIGLSNPSYKLHVVGDTNLSSGYVYRINGVQVLSSSSLGIGITNSYLTAVGTITTGVWAATAITAYYGGTGYNSYTKGDILVGAGNTFIKLGVGSDNYVLTASSSSATGLTWSPTAATGLTTLNSLTSTQQYFATGTSGSGFNISSSGSTHTFNIPIAGIASTGLVSTLSQSFAGIKTFSNDLIVSSSTVSTSTSTGALTVAGGVGIGGSLFLSTSIPSSLSGVVVNNGVITSGSWAGSTITSYYGGTGFQTYSTGDLLVGAGSTITKIAVGTNNFILVADNTAPGGIKWASAAGIAITNINGLTASKQDLAFGYSGTVPAFSSSGSTHTLNIPLAGIGSTGLVSTQAQSFAGIKTFTNAVAVTDNTGSGSYTSGALVVTGGVGIGGTLNVQGDLNVQGTFTTINSTTINVADKNIELGVVAVPTDLTAEAGGITLRGATNKSINWYSGVGWSSSESWNLASGNTYKINNTTVLSSNTLGTGVIFSSIQTAGIITSGTWSATAITALYGGTGLVPSFVVGDILYANTTSTWGRLAANSNAGYVLTSAGSGATPTYVAQSTLSVGNATTAGFATTASYAYQSGYGITSGFATTSANLNVVNAASGTFYPVLSNTASSTSGIGASVNGYFSFNAATGAFGATSVNIISGQSYSIGGNSVLSGSSLGTGVSNSYLTAVGTISTGVWSATAITAYYGGTGYNSYTKGDILVGAGNTFIKLGVGSDNYVLTASSSSSTGLTWSPTAATGITTLNSLSATQQYFATGSTGTGFNISSSGSTHTFNIPIAGTGATGLVSTLTQTFTGAKTFDTTLTVSATTPSTSYSSGALIVSGGAGFAGTIYTQTDVYVGNSTTGRLFFSQATMGSAGTTVIPSMAFIGATNSPITLSVLADNSLSFDGSSGQLFSINNNLSSGWIFAVNDISGLPLLRANADGTVAMGEFSGNIGIGLSNPSYKLHVVGDTNLSSGYVYRINGTQVLSSSSLGIGVTNSYLTALGTITTGTWAATAITGRYGGTGYTNYTLGDLLVGAGSTFIKLPVGINSYVLGADSSKPSGVGWTTVTPLTVSDTAPSSPKNADLWFNSFDGGLLVYYQDNDTSQWVEIALGSGIDLSQPVHITNTTPSTSTSTGALIVDGGVGIQGELHTSSLIINGTYDVVGQSVTLSTTSVNQPIYSLDASVYRSVKFMIQITHGTDYQVQEILLLQDGVDTYLTQYAQLLSGNNLVLATYDADLNSGNMRLLVTPTYTNTTFKIYGTAVRL